MQEPKVEYATRRGIVLELQRRIRDSTKTVRQAILLKSKNQYYKSIVIERVGGFTYKSRFLRKRQRRHWNAVKSFKLDILYFFSSQATNYIDANP